MKGQQYYKVGNHLYELNGNDIFVVSPGILHSTGNFPEDKGELFWIQLLMDKSNGKLCNLPEKQSRILLDSLTGKSEYVFKGAFQLKFTLEKLIFQLKEPSSPFKIIIINHLIVELLLETILLSQKLLPSSSSEKLAILDEYIMKNFHRSIYVDELASLLKMSTGYFKTWFKSKSGMPPEEHINRLQIEQAKVSFLRQNSVTKVAFDLGFSSSQYFATTFKKFTGHSPKTYISSAIGR